MGIFNGMVIAPDTFESTGRNIYSATGTSLTDPQHTIKINPGTLSLARKGSDEKRRTASWVVTEEFDVTVPSSGQPARQRVQVTVQVSAGMDMTEAQINAVVDAAAIVPDSGRLARILKGGA